MCEWGTNVTLRVPVHPDDSHTGEFRWDDRAIDLCIAPIVQALNDAGILTRGCCCGHGKRAGNIWLHDGRSLIISERHPTELENMPERWWKGSDWTREGVQELIEENDPDTEVDIQVTMKRSDVDMLNEALGETELTPNDVLRLWAQLILR